MATPVIMPQLGEAVIEGTIARWLKEPGDAIALYEPLLEIETDKVTTEATAEVAGTLLKILIPAGEIVEVGTVLALIGEVGEEVASDFDPSAALPSIVTSEAPASSVATSRKPLPPPPPRNGPIGGSSRGYSGRISPVVGRIAQEHQVDLSSIEGTGRDGRITKRDILNHIELRETNPALAVIEETLPAQSAAPTAGIGSKAVPGEILPLTSIRRAIADHMVRSKHTSPHVTTVFEIDFSDVSIHRQANKEIFARDGANLTFTTYIISGAVQALKKHPLVNSSWSDEGIRVNKEINIGLAAAIDDGLIVPVIKDAAHLSLLGIAQAANDLTLRARSNKLLPDEVQGGTFTLTNHGVSGSLFATPIINQPQCAILGMGKIEKRVKVINDAIAIRLMAYASLTFDHRILDGAAADSFMASFAQIIENWN